MSKTTLFKSAALFLLVVLSVVSVSPAETATDAWTAQDAVASVEGHYAGLTGLTARVTQKNFLKAVDRTQTFEGALSVRKPGKLRIDYTNGQIILIDGKTAQFYSKKSEQLIKKTFAGIQEMNIPVAFLLGAANIRDDFDARLPDPKKPRDLELLPKKSGAAMQKLALEIDAGGRILGLTIFDKSGNTTELAFTDVREGVELDDKVFRFKAPKGTEIIEQ